MSYFCTLFNHTPADMSKLEDKSDAKIWLHKWGIPISHACLWMVGLLVTTDFLNVLKQLFSNNSEQYAISLGVVIVIFFGEIILTFVDCAIEKEDLLLNMTFCRFIALFITTIVAVVVFMFLGCHFLSNADIQYIGKCFIGMVILVSSFTKGMEIWLQNNWDKYTIDSPKRVPELNFSI